MEPGCSSFSNEYCNDSEDDFDDDDDESFNFESFSDNLNAENVDTVADRQKANQFLSGNMTFKDYTATVESKNTACKVVKDDRDIIRKSRKNLPPVLKGLMGEANLFFARGNYDSALNLCLEVIREMPTAPAPFQTLSQIYEERGMTDKSLQCALIAAHLSPRGSEQWVTLAQSCLQHKDVQLAIYCYSKAIKYDKNNIDLHLIKANLQNEINDTRGVYKTYNRMVEVLKPNHGNKILEYAKLTAQYYHENVDQGVLKAKEIMEKAFKKVPTLVKAEDVNLMAELLISLKEYFKALEIITLYCDVRIEGEEDILVDEAGNETTSLRVLNCVIPDDLPIELRVQLTVLLIKIEAYHLLPNLLEYFEQSEEIEQSGDLFIDVVEALMSQNKHADALNILKLLVNSTNFSLAAVWLNYAECLKICNKTEEAISAYLVVMELAPQHMEARITVSELLNNVGKTDEAINVLSQDPTSELMNAQLLYEKCLLLKDNPEKKDELIAFGRLLLSRHCLCIKSPEQLFSLSKLRVFSHKQVEALRRIQEQAVEKKRDFVESDLSPTVQEEWNLFRDICDEVFKQKQYALLERIVFSALGSLKFNSHQTDASMKHDLLNIALLACFFNQDETHGYNFVRDLAVNCPDIHATWNIFNLIIYNAPDIGRHSKFVIRQLARKPDQIPLTLLHANNCLASGSFKYALSEFISCYHQEPSAYLAFIIGITKLLMSGSRNTIRKNALVTQAVAYFQQYKRYRCSYMIQEVHYNLGRLYHQLGLLPSALFHYQQALKCSNVLIEKHPELLDLTRETAFNLSLIYQSSGSLDLARHIIEKYIII